MEDTELLEALDRRAGRAVTALDAGLAGAEPAPLPIDAGRDRRRPWVPLLVAAALVVVALVGIGLALDGRDDEQGTVADDQDVPVETDDSGITRLALPDPTALGYEVRAAFDGSTIPQTPEMAGIDVSLTAHGPTGAQDPWQSAVVTRSVPIDEYTFFGELVDVGGPEAVHLPTGRTERVVWRQGDQARMLMSSRVLGDDLVRVAAAAVAAGWDGTGPLPGHDILHDGTADEFQAGLEYAPLGPTGWQGLAYDRTGTDADFIIAWRPGSVDALHALHVFEPEPRSQRVDGREVLLSDAGSATHTAWLLEDGTLVQLATYGDVGEVLDEVLPQLEPLEEDPFQALVARHPAPTDGQGVVDVPVEVHEPMGDGEPIASVSLAEGAYEYRVQIHPDGPDGLATMVTIDDGSGASGSGGPLRDLVTPFLMKDGQSSGPDGPPLTPTVISGLLPPGVPPDLGGMRAVDRSTGAELTVIDRASGTVPGSDLLLVIALVDADPATMEVDVTFQTSDGERTWRL